MAPFIYTGEMATDADCVKACTGLVVEETAPVGRPKKTWQNIAIADMRLLKIDSRTSTTE